MTTGIMDFDTDGSITGTALSFGEVREMVHIAHEEGFCVMSHTNGARAVKEAAAAGADSIEHGNYVDEEAVEVMAEMGTVWRAYHYCCKESHRKRQVSPIRSLKRSGKKERKISEEDMKQG